MFFEKHQGEPANEEADIQADKAIMAFTVDLRLTTMSYYDNRQDCFGKYAFVRHGRLRSASWS